MNRFKLAGICVLISSLALSGCAARTCNLTRDRVDQEFSLTSGNRGYITGQASEPEESKTLSRIIEKPTPVNEMEMDSVISVFSEAIKKNPNYAGAYYNRAIAYFYKNNYEQCWQDVQMAESLGCRFSADFIKSLKKVSPREK
jgi:tetratricopeptide (TPR) repeat protein